jgi:hypothetical protein
VKLKRTAQWGIKAGDVVRMRSVGVDQKKGEGENLLYLNPRSNIMVFPASHRLAEEIVQEVSEDEKIMKLMLCEEEKCILDRPRIISRVSEKYAAKKHTNLFTLFHKGDPQVQSLPVVRVKFYVLNM